MQGGYLGPAYDDARAEAALKARGLVYEQFDDEAALLEAMSAALEGGADGLGGGVELPLAVEAVEPAGDADPDPVELIVTDASFIGLETLLPAPLALAAVTTFAAPAWADEEAAVSDAELEVTLELLVRVPNFNQREDLAAAVGEIGNAQA